MEGLLIALIPLVMVAVAHFKWPDRISWKEALIGIAISLVTAFGITYLGMYSETVDYEVWNGEVKSKTSEHVSCEHSYECFCSTDSKGNRTCSTCYEHSYDVSWYVKTNIGLFEINRVDRRGLTEPDRWSRVQIGDAVSAVHSYTNWVKAVPESLFNLSPMSETELVPDYPIRQYDYYRVDRVIAVGDVGLDKNALHQWSAVLQDTVKTLGPTKQANVVVVLTTQPTDSFGEAIRQSWLGGKKNDIVVVIGVNGSVNAKPAWVTVFSWSKNDLINVSLRDDILALDRITVDNLFPTIYKDVVENYVRRPMKEFEYLRDEIDPPTWAVVLAFIFSIGATGGFLVFAYREDIM